LVFGFDGHRDVLQEGSHAADSFSGCEIYNSGEEVSVYAKDFYSSRGKVDGVGRLGGNAVATREI